MTHVGLSRALVACLGLGAIDVAALNLAVLPAIGSPAVPRAAAPPALPASSLELARSSPSHDRAHGDARGAEREPAANPAELAPAPAPAARAPVAVLEFEPASRRLDRQASSTLDDVLTSLAAGDQIVVIGHADASGPDELNERLSAARAAAVARRLRKAGISRSRIRLEAHGEREPRDDGNDRRVEIYLGGCP